MTSIGGVLNSVDENCNSPTVKNREDNVCEKGIKDEILSDEQYIKGVELRAAAKDKCEEIEEVLSEVSCSSDEVDYRPYYPALRDSTEHLLLVMDHPEVFRSLPESELKAVQQKIYKISTAQLNCIMCNLNIPSADHEGIRRHIEKCWGYPGRGDKMLDGLAGKLEEEKSVYTQLQNLAGAMFGVPNDVEDEYEPALPDLDEARDHMDVCRNGKERLLYLCEMEGFTSAVLCFRKAGTVKDLLKELQFLCNCVNLNLTVGSSKSIATINLPLEAILSGEAVCSEGGNVKITITKLGSFDLFSGCVLEFNAICEDYSSDMLMVSSPEKICSTCKTEYGKFIVDSKEVCSELKVGTSSLFSPRTFCSKACIRGFYPDSDPKNIWIEMPIPIGECSQCYRMDMLCNGSTISFENDSIVNDCSHKDCSTCCDTTGNLGDKSTASSKGSMCCCGDCANSSSMINSSSCYDNSSDHSCNDDPANCSSCCPEDDKN